MRTVLIVIALIAVTASLAYGAIAYASDFTPIFGEGDHTVWDEDEEDFGNTYSYYSLPTNYGWFTFIAAGGEYSWLAPTCYYEEEDDSASIALRFGLNSGLPFADAQVAVTFTFDDDYELEGNMTRRTEDHDVLEIRVAGLSRTRAAETIDVDIGPFTFTHEVKDLFDVPAAGNIDWCEAKYQSATPTPTATPTS